jgi:hypothetical protein
MTEDDARRVLLLRAFESPPGDAGWHDEDRAWATRQAIAAVGDGAAPERFVATRATLALTRLLPRAPEAAQLGPPQRVNLLAPAVWAVVLWNLFVYATALLPQPKLGLLARGLASRLGRMASRPRLQADWLHAAAPLLARRAALLMHSAAAGLALGLIGGLYLRGLVMDYRAGWQSTFLDAASVQAGLSFALAPASWLTGVAVPVVAPLQLAPGTAAAASAAPWIHLYADVGCGAAAQRAGGLGRLAGSLAGAPVAAATGRRLLRGPAPADAPRHQPAADAAVVPVGAAHRAGPPAGP